MIQRLNKIILLTIAILLISNYTYAATLPNIEAESYIAIDANSGRIISARNANQKLPMASTTKIMTSILTIENNNNLDTIIEITEKCTNIEGSSLYLKPKQRVSIIDLLYGTMLRSGNDAALAVANFTGKNSIDRFIKMMNKKAKELGAYNTNFTNPNGLHDDDHYTTAYDLALISQYAMKNNTFREISSSKSYKANSLNTTIYNKNKVVHQYSLGTGIKIGYTKTAGRCLVASAKSEDTEIIVVLLNDNNWFNDSYKIFDWTFENYKYTKIIDKHQYVGDGINGEPIFTSEEFGYLLTEEELENIKFVPYYTIPHISNDQNFIINGYFDIFIGDELIHTGKLISSK
ncbi:MAG: D-alanyl-D-alanine carboxypeptidase [Tissierellia bacterium]|nr:D-alanyl-D-alanine carboxypeptidase [Tissierellia bacterium]